MRRIDLLWLSLHYIRHRFLESFMVVLGITLGVGIISTILGIFASYQGSVGMTLNNPMLREIRVHPRQESTAPFSSIQKIDLESGNFGPSVRFTLEEIGEAKAAAPSVDYGFAVNWERFRLGESDRPLPRPGNIRRDPDGSVTVVGPREGEKTAEASGKVPPNAQVDAFAGRGVTPEFFQSYQLQPEHGALIGEVDIREELPVVVLGATLARRLYPETDPAVVIGERIQLNGIGYHIAGILGPASKELDTFAESIDAGAFIPITVTRSYLFSKALHSLTFAVENTAQIDRAASQLEAHFAVEYGDDITVDTRREDYLEQRRRILPALTVIGILSSMGLFIASINILNLMLARVIRRRKAIGISAAMGGSKGSIFWQYVTEALTLGSIGGFCGIGLSVLLMRFLTFILQSRAPAGAGHGPLFSVSITTIAIAVGITLLINLIFGVYPAYKASTVDPAESLRN